MATSPSKVQRQPLLTFFSCLTTISLALLAYGYKSTSKNIYNQFPAILSILNPELFPHDFYVREMLQFTPRFYYYHLIAWGVKSGLDLGVVCFGLYAIAFSSFAIGLYAIGRQFDRSRISATALAFLGLAATINGRVGFADLFRTDPLPATLAMGIAIWGFYFCFRQRWILGYFIFGLTCLMQFLVGALPGMLMAIPLVISSLKDRQYRRIVFAFTALVVCACFVYIPMLLLGNTGSGAIGNEEFVYLYAYVRHPHHLLFSSFGTVGERGWLNFILFTAGGLLCIESSRTLSNSVKLQLQAVIVSACILLLTNYVFVELYPLDFISKLQFARTTPFSQLAILIGISVLVDEQYRRGNVPVICLAIVSTILRDGGIVLLAIGLGLWLENRKIESPQYPLSLTSFPWILMVVSFISIYNQLYVVAILSLVALVLLFYLFSTDRIKSIIDNFWVKLISFASLIVLLS